MLQDELKKNPSYERKISSNFIVDQCTFLKIKANKRKNPKCQAIYSLSEYFKLSQTLSLPK